MRLGRIVAVVVALSTPGFLPAQLPAYNIPDDPAFVFLGATPKKVANPGTVSALGLAIADGIDIDGRVNAGLAISFLPSNIIRYSPSPDNYRNGTPGFWLYNTQTSVGTIRASGDTGSTDLGYGLRTILRGPEPYTDQTFRNSIASVLDRCLAEARGVDSSTLVLEERVGVRVAPVRDPANPTVVLKPNEGKPIAEDTLEITYLDPRGRGARTERVVVRKIRNGSRITQDTVRTWKPHPNTLNSAMAVDCANRGKSQILKAWMENHWNDATLALSAAGGTRFRQSSVRRARPLGAGFWLLAGLPIRWSKGQEPERDVLNLGQIAAQLHYATAPRSAAGGSPHSWDWGLRAMAGQARYNGFAELTRSLKKGQNQPEARAWSTGVEYMAAESIWLSVGIGDRFSQVTSDSRTFVFMNLKWGLARNSQLGG
jgi:hypothetical protein